MLAWAVFGKKYKLASHLTQLGVAKLIRSEHSSQVHGKRISACLQLRGGKIKPLVNAASVKHAALIQRVVSTKASNEPAEGREGRRHDTHLGERVKMGDSWAHTS